MNNNYVKKLLFVVLCFSSLCCSNEEPEESDFFVLTIPKSGSHLILKMLNMLTGKTNTTKYRLFPHLNAFNFKEDNPSIIISLEQVEEAFLSWKADNQFALAHFNFAEDFYPFWLNHPEYVKIIQIRDLRDVCVSCVFHQSQDIEREVGPCTFADKLLYVISMGSNPTKNRLFRIKKYAQIAVEWLQDPETVVCRFENLVGEKGGGSQDAQKKEITEVANRLGIHLDTEKLDWISNNLFGVKSGPLIPSTYREGKIGSWRDYFNDEHKKAFEEHLGEVQLNLGYGLFDDENEVLAIPRDYSLVKKNRGNSF